MIDLIAIKIDKLFNIQKNKNETEKRNSKLVYYIRQYSCFPEHAEYVYQPEMLRTEKLKLFLDSLSKEEKLSSDLKRLSIYQIEIMNIGNGALQGTDFFNNSKLRIENCNFYVGNKSQDLIYFSSPPAFLSVHHFFAIWNYCGD